MEKRKESKEAEKNLKECEYEFTDESLSNSIENLRKE